MPNKKRVDILLREWNLVPSRAKAQELIALGAVEVLESGKWQVVMDESHKVDSHAKDQVRIRPNPVLDFVSRGGRKLEAALIHTGLGVDGLRALDIGISTGGFSHCLLQRGAAQVIGVDVGHGQLAQDLKNNPHLMAFEGINARDLSANESLAPHLAGGFDLIVIDVSFISLTQVLAEAVSALRSQGHILALVKPQFELSSRDLNKKGVVTNLELHSQVREKVTAFAGQLKLTILDYFPCEVPGQDGNQEFFLYAQKS